MEKVGEMANAQKDIDETPPEYSAAHTQPERTELSTSRMFAMIGFIGCNAIQAMAIGHDGLILVAMIVLVGWYLLLPSMFPLCVIFIGNLFIRLAMYNNRFMQYFLDRTPGDFILPLIDSVSLVALMAFSFSYFELNPKRLHPKGKDYIENRRMWHVFEPFQSLFISLPLALMMAVGAYFVADRIPSPIQPGILRVHYVQTYLLVWFLFVMVVLARIFFDYREWRSSTSDESKFYLYRQLSCSLDKELDLIGRNGWSQNDHASAAGGMFFIQCLLATVVTLILLAVSRSREFGSSLFMWPLIAGAFVVLTSFFNARKSASGDVTTENHVISFVGFFVVCIGGVFATNQASFPAWPWGVVYSIWTAINGLILIRLSYLWIHDESFARQNQWERALPFSWIRFLFILLEGTCGFIAVFVVSRELYRFFEF